jgi:hypothetical protein
MQPAFWFWLFEALFILGCLFFGWRADPAARPGFGWVAFFVVVLTMLLGWNVFGGPVK